LIGQRNRAVDSTKSRIGPIESCGKKPLRRTILIGINNANAAPARPLGIVHRPEDPISRPAHLHHSVDTFARGKRKHINRGARRHRISIEGSHEKPVTRQMEMDLFRSPGMNKLEPNLLAGSYADRFLSTEQFVTNPDKDFPILNQGSEGGSTHGLTSSSSPGQLKEASAFHIST
jgi:hypothetical protein